MGTTLVIIDPQRDFIDDRSDPKFDPALPVTGSTADMQRLVDMLVVYGDKFDRIVVPLDQHPPDHIAHALMWVDRNGRHPAPFSSIKAYDVKAGVWSASLPQNQAAQATYVEAAEAAGHNLTIWNPHCIIGSAGAAVYEPLMDALRQWWEPGRDLLFFPKSGYWGSEQFSSLRAAVPVHGEPSTLYNTRMRNAMIDDRVYIAGEALGHCVAYTVMDLINGDGAENPIIPELAQYTTLLTDCTSSVAGFETLGQLFVNDFQRLGGKVAKSTELFPKLLDIEGL